MILVPVQNLKGSEIVRALHQRVFPQCGIPEVIVVDQQRSLISKEVQQYADAHGIDILPIPPGAKDKNAIAERAIRTFRDLLGKMMRGKPWKSWEG